MEPTLLQLSYALNSIVLAESKIVPLVRRILNEGDESFRAADTAQKGDQRSALSIKRRNALRRWIVGHLQQLGAVKSSLTADGLMEIALVEFLFFFGVCKDGSALVDPCGRAAIREHVCDYNMCQLMA